MFYLTVPIEAKYYAKIYENASTYTYHDMSCYGSDIGLWISICYVKWEGK